jgi:cytochrome c peroxidase
VVPALKDNAVTHEKVDLGKLLFFAPRLSASEIISCKYPILPTRTDSTPEPSLMK